AGTSGNSFMRGRASAFRVAETSNSAVDYCKNCSIQKRRFSPQSRADLEIGDTAGLETCAPKPRSSDAYSGRMANQSFQELRTRPSKHRREKLCRRRAGESLPNAHEDNHRWRCWW